MRALYGYVLAGTFPHAASNVLQKKFLGTGIHPHYMTVVWMLGASFVGFLGNFIFYGIPAVASGFLGHYLIVAILNVFIMLFSVKAKQLEDVSWVEPISSISPILTIPLAILILGERTTFWGFWGIVGIVPGLYILGFGGKKVDMPPLIAKILPASWHNVAGRWGGPWLKLGSSKGARLALIVACLGAVAITFDKQVVLASNPLFRTGTVFSFVAIMVFSYSWLKGEWQTMSHPRGTFARVFGIGMLLGSADALYSAGYYSEIVPYVGAIKRITTLWTVIVGALALKEPYGVARLIGSLILVVGAFLLAF